MKILKIIKTMLKLAKAVIYYIDKLSHGPMVASPPKKSHSESFLGPALGTVPARGP